jgi:hypothetical protein
MFHVTLKHACLNWICGCYLGHVSANIRGVHVFGRCARIWPVASVLVPSVLVPSSTTSRLSWLLLCSQRAMFAFRSI